MASSDAHNEYIGDLQREVADLRSRNESAQQQLQRLREDPLEWLAASGSAASQPAPSAPADVDSRLISVIVPLHNGAAFIERCLDSAATQQPCGYGLEIIVCDDGSRDDSLATARAWAARHQIPVHVLTHEDAGNHGVSATRNRCAAHARGAFLALLDADDVWLPHKLATQMPHFEQHPESTCVCAFGYNRNLAGEPLPGWSGTELAGDHRRAPAPLDFRPPYDFDQLLRGDPIVNSTVIVRREAFHRAGGYPRTMSHQAEDWLLFLKLSLAAPIQLIPEPLIHYTVHEGSYTAEYLRAGFASGSRLEVLLFLLHWMLQRPEHHERARRIYRRHYATLLAGMGGARRLAESFYQAHPEAQGSLHHFEQHLNELYRELDELRNYRNHIEAQLNRLRRIPGLKALYHAARWLGGRSG